MVEEMESDILWWKRGRKLGSGGFGIVSLAEVYDSEYASFNTTPLLMAVKSAELSLSRSLRKESKLLQQLQGCPYLLRCFGNETSTENGVELFNVLLEYASGGSLADRIRGFGLPKYHVRRHTKAVLMGLTHIHNQGYVHCDIKPHNILLVATDEGHSEETAKLADLGLAMKAAKKISPKLRGTAMYMAPESVRYGEYQPSSDIWALGCTVLEMITGKLPWNCEPHTEPCALLYRIGWGKELPEIPSWLSKDAKDFLGRCLVDDPKKRWSADMLLGHPFLSSIDSATVVAEEKQSKALPSEAINTTSVLSSQGSNDLRIRPLKKRGWGLIDREHDGESFCKKIRTMEEVRGAQQQSNIACYESYWGVEGYAAAVYNSKDHYSSLSLEWFL